MKTELEIASFLVNNSEKINSICRVCLTETSTKWTALFENQSSVSFSEKIMLCTRVQINVDDGLPNMICDQCYGELDLADTFRIKCEFSDSILRKIFTNGLKDSTSTKEEELSVHSDDLKEESSFIDGDNFDDENEDIKSETSEKQKISQNLDELSSTEPKHVKHKKKKHKSSKIPKSEISQKIKKEEDTCDENIFETISDSLEKTDNSASESSEKSKGKKFSCQICNKPLSSSTSLDKHIRNMHSEDKKKKQVGRVSGYGADRRFHCTECDYETRFKTDLVCHVRRHTGEKPYRCDICQRSFAQHATLNNHKKTHSDTMYYTCPQCGKQFKYKNRYDRHKSSHTEQKLYNCTICNKGLKTQKILEEHMNRHYNIKNFNCETCGSTFVTFSEMTVHSRIHGTEKRFQCNICEYRTFVKASLEKHTRRHTGERPFRCEVCDWACYTRGELKIHLRKHTKEKNYPCPVCQTKFMSSSGVNKHMVRTHGVKFKWSDHRDRRVIK